jgi:hypothetical protein
MKVQVGTYAQQYYVYRVEVDDETNYGGDFLISIPNHLQGNKGYSSVEFDYLILTLQNVFNAN